MIYRAHYVVPITQDVIEDGEVLVRNGRIEGVGPDISASFPDEPITDLGHAAIIPGLVNAHTHLDYTIARGLLDDEPFFPWIRRMTEIGARLEYDDFLASSRLGAMQLVRSGVTTAADSSFSGAAVTAMSEAGLRGVVYQETFGSDPSKDYHEQIDSLAEKIVELRGIAGDRIEIGVSPHSIYTASEPLLRLIADLALDLNLPVAIHVAESRDEVDFISSCTGPIADIYRGLGYNLKPRNVSPVQYLHDIGLLGRRTTAAHCVHLTDTDLDILAEEQCGVVHCPKSNAKLGVGIARLTDIVLRGIPTGIGTDSAVSDNRLDMFEEMRFAVLAQRSVRSDTSAMNAERVLELATLGGAAALGMVPDIGSLEEGKLADMVAVDLSSAEAYPTQDPCSAIVHCATARDVIMTMVEGEIIYLNGQHTRIDAKDVMRRAALVAMKL